jgi:hypothetical protein
MFEEKEFDELEDEEYEDLDDLESIAIEVEEFSDLAGLEDLPEEQEVGFTGSDVIITYGEKVEDEMKALEKRFNEKLKELENADPDLALREMSDLLNDSRMLEAHQITSKISSYIASLLTILENHRDATEYYLQSVSEARKSGDKQLHLECLTPFGLNLIHFDPKDASVVFSQAISLAEELKNEEAYAQNTIHLANCLALSDKKQAVQLYNEGKKYFEKIKDNEWLGIINYKIGNIYLKINEYQTAFELLIDAKEKLSKHPETLEALKVDKAIKTTKYILMYGHSIKDRLSIPRPEAIEDTPNIKKIYELLSSNGSFDIIKSIKTIDNVQEPTEREAFDSLKCLFRGSNIDRKSDDEIEDDSELYERIGELYLKAGFPANGFYNFVAAQSLNYLAGENKKADKLDKRISKIIENIAGENTQQLFDMQIYLYYQIAYCIADKQPKESRKFVEKGIELSRKRDNPYYEALNKEILAGILGKNQEDKAIVEYESAISIFESLEDQVDLLRILEKFGDILLESHHDKAKEIYNRAMNIAKELEESDSINRLKDKL